MGAHSISVTAQGKDINDAFRNAVAEANDYYGHQEGYSGAINTCELRRDVTSKRPTMTQDELEEWILEQTSKREVFGYCINQPKKNENKIKTQVHNMPQHGTRKWQTVYEAVNWEGTVRASASKQTECITKARKYVSEHPNEELTVRISKQLVEGNKDCAKIRYKKAAGERLGTYVFVGWAAC